MDLRLGDPEFPGGVDRDGFLGFVEDTDLGPDVRFFGVEGSREAKGPGYQLTSLGIGRFQRFQEETAAVLNSTIQLSRGPHP